MHIGHRILEIMTQQGRTAAWLAARICVSRTHVYKIFRKDSIDMAMLMRISQALRHDFFAEISRDFKAQE